MDTPITPTVNFTLAGARVSIPEATIIEDWKARAGVGVMQPPFGVRLRIGDMVHGQTFMGIVRNEDGLEYRIWDMGEATSTMTHEAAVAWAKEGGGDLPTRREQSIMFGNRAPGQYKEAWYWSKETRAGDESSAWIQIFGDGYQSYGRKSNDCRARAVRREVIQ